MIHCRQCATTAMNENYHFRRKRIRLNISFVTYAERGSGQMKVDKVTCFRFIQDGGTHASSVLWNRFPVQTKFTRTPNELYRAHVEGLLVQSVDLVHGEITGVMTNWMRRAR